jgi:hypothetical protein
MAYSIIAQPQDFTPVYNPIYFYIDSSNKGEEGFKYIADVFSAGTNDRLSRYKLFPRPNDGYGVVDVNQILSTQTTYTLDQNAHSFNQCFNDYVNYDVRFGEEFIYFWPFDDTLFTLTGSTSGFTTFINTGSTTPHYFVSGDSIVISASSVDYNGLVGTVTDVLNDYSFETNIPWFSGTNAGTVVFSDYAKTVFLYNVISTANTAFNGGVSHQNFPTYQQSGYTLNTVSPNSRKFVTSVPNEYSVKIENNMWIHYHITSGGTRPLGMYVNTFDANGNALGMYNFSNVLTGATKPMEQVACGPNDLLNFSPSGTVISGSSSIFGANVASYTVYLYVNVLGTDLRISEIKTFNINSDCFKYTNIELLFMDRLGSFIPANFELNSIRSININRSEFKRIVGDLNGSSWNYQSTEFGNTPLNINEVQQLEIQSNWLSETDAAFLKELYTSPAVFIKEKGQFWPVLVRTNTIQLLTKNNKKNLAYRMVIEYSNNDSINTIY